MLSSHEKTVLTSIQHLTYSFSLFKARKRISVVTICNNRRSPELLEEVQKYCIPSLTLSLFWFWCPYMVIILTLVYSMAALHSIVLRYAGAPIATRLSFFLFSFFFFGDVFFSKFAAFSLYGEYIVRSFLPNGVFLPCDHGLDC